MKIRVGQGYDVHRWVEGRPCILGGVEIPSEKGPLGHSDADVVCHVLCDALLGAANMRNIGYHFSDKDPMWKGVASTLLLKKVMEMIREAGWELANADVTVILDQPKLNPIIPAIKDNLASVMGVEVDQISVKATTSEGLGFVGRAEGISAMAVALIQKE
ncbi:2-C-methyl-D-erythritol 2,4-cyclodiphosphate synthase [Aquirufa antheringensis]|jgi:2-C-methyl-D-erythritol 2,4-cyclodiphosphate synthase|uniref:2-C-methyl-D-erythritol 2,4-cyclodiphosphate synthase n=1 Tax=Aquirufa antheringensis TaxID=2516559 RepID=UPI00103282DB|nr:2-C-methyl-D-erythritol 2,4-cyclodiphosphate synthase [Aquirufa antheringensis]MCE4217088.1 2-C-methyl-D-erythritol 2,4-cyclodiphosphate synthase [Pseudarcicella sp. GAP-15]MCL9968158.1 2-C-methyl-D-erythritol 2,4-cyclodiphosphate synthase [Aquirufa antheringensis]MCZ2478329.1 2-C-methyl-D-erythritol 2,4-cyclodiphosphate synthase [Aquirufa antheringensis]TBH72647.1 2-C-methyl-D-erythritol 2,4-cyclodiphosphate synthase [Aquirufa antheringensis]USQ03050.1 2-C-methyl-D-erythritol 2,4-cyclodiph